MLGEIIAALSNWMYTYLLVILLVAAGLFFTIRNRFPQLRLLRESIRVVVERPEKEGSVSSFQALMVSTASRVGTGNIIGVSVAICVGGYGAVFWMWLIALLGGATAFTESTLAQIYKRRNPETGESYGGPAYYIEAALHSRPLAVLFALSLIATYAGGFNMLCSYNLQSTFSGYGFYNPELTPWIIGGIVALLTGYCVMGGGKRIIAFASTLVPIMGGLYVLVALVVIVMNVGLIPQVFGRIFEGAFDFQAIFAGFTGSAVMQGVKRGLFSNEAGVGSAPNAAASANVSHPVKQGLVQMLSVFIDTILICSTTAFMLLLSGVPIDADPDLEKRIAALVSSGEEDVSFSQAEGQLREWLNRRKVNKSVGLIPRLEGELAETGAVLSRLEEANRTLSRLEGEKAELEGRKTVLEAERRTHHRLDALELDRRYTQARQDLEAARRQADGAAEASTGEDQPRGRHRPPCGERGRCERDHSSGRRGTEETMKQKLIYVCSPYRGNTETNTQNARRYCRLVMEQGGIPFAPHLLFTQFLDDAIPKERERGLRMGTQMLGLCDELWAFGEPSEGMRMEIEQAGRLGIPVRRLYVAGGAANER